MESNPKAKTPFHFKMSIRGTAYYDPDNQQYLFEKDPIAISKFNKLANAIFQANKQKLESLFNEMKPLQINPIIDGEITFDGVVDEEDPPQ